MDKLVEFVGQNQLDQMNLVRNYVLDAVKYLKIWSNPTLALPKNA